MFWRMPSGHAEHVVDRLHPERVAPGEIVVDGDEVHPRPPSELSTTAVVAVSVLPSPVFISAIAAVVEDHAADQLHVEVAHSHRPLAGLAHEREAFGQQIVEALTALRALPEGVGAGAQLLVIVMLELGLERVDQTDTLLVAFELLCLAQAKRSVQEGHGSRVARAGLRRAPAGGCSARPRRASVTRRRR